MYIYIIFRNDITRKRNNAHNTKENVKGSIW